MGPRVPNRVGRFQTAAVHPSLKYGLKLEKTSSASLIRSSQSTPSELPHSSQIVFLVYAASHLHWSRNMSKLKQVARTNAMASEIGGAAASAAGDEGYGVLMISDALGGTEVMALEKVRPSRQLLER